MRTSRTGDGRRYAWSRRKAIFSVGEGTMKYNSRCLWISLTFIISAILSCGSTDDEPERPFESSIDTVVVSVSDTLGLLVGDSSLVFGTITQASWGKDGRLYVLDGQFGRLAIYSEELEFFRYIGRLGSGPGEFQYPQSFAFLSDGRLAVCDWGAGRVVFFDSSFQYVDHLYGYYPDSPRYIAPGPGSTYVAMNMELDQSEGELEGNSFIARFGREMEPEHIYDSWPLVISTYGNPENPDISIGRVDHDFDSNLEGTVYLAERDDSTYLVEVFLADGTVDTLVNRSWERVEKSQDQREQEFFEETKNQNEDGSQMGRHTVQDIYPYLNAIGSVDVDPDGNIWVGQAYTDIPTFEVYSPSGELSFVAVIPELVAVEGLEYCFRNGYLAYDRQPVDYPKVYILEPDTIAIER